jgi:L-malate glycosyltransferase
MNGRPSVVSALDLDPCKFGSFEEYTVALSRGLKERGWRSVVAFARPLPGQVMEHFRDSGATIEVFTKGAWRGYIPSLNQILREYRPEIVHFCYFDQFSLTPIMAWLAGAKIIVFTAAVTVPKSFGYPARVKHYLWDRIVLRLLRIRILAVSEHVKQTLVDCYMKRPAEIRPLLNGINTERLPTLRPRKSLSSATN